MITYNEITKKLMNFFWNKGFELIDTQSKQSILAACEDPNTIANYTMQDIKFPLPQTGQMNLELALLENRNLEGVFCLTTSYRNEPNPIPGRHDLIFPMIEFEGRGNVRDLIQLELKLLCALGIDIIKYREFFYQDICRMFRVDIIGAAEEEELLEQFFEVVFLTHFPFRSDPFWNMQRLDHDIYNKVDLILNGIETIGGAERSCDPVQMREDFCRVSGGKYAAKLFEEFGKDRVEAELESYLAHDFTPRFGGGIGISRLMRTLNKLTETG